MSIVFRSTLDEVQILYLGYFGRAGDPDGTAFWVSQLDARHTSIAGVASLYAEQEEAKLQYPYLASFCLADAEGFINSIYRNLFNREADEAGKRYWVHNLAQRQEFGRGIGQFVLDVISGAEETDVHTLRNKLDVANYYTLQLAKADSDQASLGSMARDAVAKVTSNPDTVVTTKRQIDHWLATAATRPP